MGEKKIKKTGSLIVIGILIVILLAYLLIIVLPKSKAAKEADVQLDLRQEQRSQALAEGERLFRGYYYEEALKVLKEAPQLSETEKQTLLTDSRKGNETRMTDEIQNKIEEIEQAEASLVKYEGKVQHVFFHSLIVYPQLAFDDVGHSPEGYNMWMTTVREFKAMLPKLLERGYVLYDLNRVYEADTENPGQVRQKEIYLPEGKTPLFLSIDDVNYYDYMKPDGFANRLVMGKDGRVWTEVMTPEGETVQTRDGDVMPILDDFVEEHPEFSWRGAKGTMALTGYQGALGYRITDKLSNTEEMQKTVKLIADTMKANGWNFACHSYTHNSSWFRTGGATLAQVQYDTNRWKEMIAPWVGDTKIYISPFGFLWKNQDPRYRYMIEEGGYQLFCPVGNGRNITDNGDHLVMPRVNLDGYTMNRRPEEVKAYYFDVTEVYDSSRPPLNL